MHQKHATVVSTVALALLVASASLQGEQQASTEPILAGHPALRASLLRIGGRSALWRADEEALRGTGRHVILLTPEAVVVSDPDNGGALSPFDPTELAEVSVVRGTGTRVEGVLVVVNLGLLERVHARRGSSAIERAADLDRILIHEIYGHAMPYLLAGDLSGRCADPRPGQRATDACSIRRENAVRAELGLGRRKDYGLGSLDLARTAPRR